MPAPIVSGKPSVKFGHYSVVPRFPSPRSTFRTAVKIGEELAGIRRARRTWMGSGRAWIEVRGLDGADGAARGDAILVAVRAMDGVQWAELNRALSRVVLAVDAAGPDLDGLCRLISETERAVGVPPNTAGSVGRPVDLPGDDVILAGRAVAWAAATAGLGQAVAGRVLRWPRLPGGAVAAVVLLDTQPRLRRALEHQVGADAADVVLAAATAAAQALTQGPAALAVDVVLRTMLVAEAKAGQRAWARDEPSLAAQAACAEPFPSTDRPVPLPPGPIERYADAAATVGLLSAAGIGIASGRLTAAADAVLVTAPRASRAARESFVTTLAAGLNDRHGCLVLRPAALRRVDRLDALVIEPRAVLADALSVTEVRGVDGSARARVWTAAQHDLDDGLIAAGWHDVAALSPGHGLDNLPHAVQVLIAPSRDAGAEGLISAARAAGLHVSSLDVAQLGNLRSAFDDLFPQDGDTDDALTSAVTELQLAGRCVAVLAVNAPRASAAADVGITVRRPDVAPGWTSDLTVPDLAAAWRLVSAVPAARGVSKRAVELSAGGALLGGLLMLPGVRGRGPGPVTAAAAVALVEGRLSAQRVLRRPAPPPSPMVSWHALNVTEVLQVAASITIDPPPSRRDQSPLLIMNLAGGSWRVSRASMQRVLDVVSAARAELSDPLTPVLAVGAAASAILGSPLDAALVGSVMAANAALATFQRLRAEQQLRGLLVADRAVVRRVEAAGYRARRAAPAGEAAELHALQSGEFIEVLAGDVVPADCRLVETDGLEMDESALTGESLPVAKGVDPTPGAPLAERACMIYEGTTVLTGQAVAVVTAAGAASAAGRAAALAPETDLSAGMQAELGTLTAKILPLTLAAGASVTLLSVLRGAGLRRAVTSGVSIAVAAVPEGLPLIATLAQQSSARRLARHEVLVRSPRAIEALGRVQVVCFDKTGTLSQNRLQVNAVQPAPGVGRHELLAAAGLATPLPMPGKPLTHATDSAVFDALGSHLPARVSELPFRPGRAFAAGLAEGSLAVKGAPETILDACALDAAARSRVEAEIDALARAGMRVLAVAGRELDATPDVDASDTIVEALATGELCLLGILGLADTLRPDATALLAGLAARGIGVRLITGDHPVTAVAIAEQLGLPVSRDQVLTGPEWDLLSQRERASAVADVVVFSRMSPEHKVQIVQELERCGRPCAMVGDGANDAAAIRAAAVGIGISTHGSDPARGAADIVLTEGRLEPLLSALDEGQQLWRRVQAALGVLLGGNAGEVAFTLYGTALTGTAPLNTRQLLLVNMLTDALPAAALAVSAVTGRHAATGRGLDVASLRTTVITRGATTTGGASLAWTMARLTGRRRRASTVGLVALVSTQLAQTLLDSRSPLVLATAGGSMAVLAATISTPGVSQLLGCTPLGPVGWTQAIGSAALATGAAAVAPRAIDLLSGLRRSRDDVRDADSHEQRVKTSNGWYEHGTHQAQKILVSNVGAN